MAPDRAWLLTPPGAGAIAVIRISGDGVGAMLSTHFSKPARIGRCVHGEFRDETGAVIDDPVIALIDECTADINLHGGGAIIRAVLASVERAGFRLEPSPIVSASEDVIEQEMVAALPFAKTKLGLSVLLAQPAAWSAMRWTAESATLALSDLSLRWLLHPPTVALMGLPNVGKSTLANQLFGQERSIVFDQPGTTRDWVGEYADIDGLPVLLVDTPGVRRTIDPLESEAIAQSREPLRRADLVVLVLDPTLPLPPQVALAEGFPNCLNVVNKADLVPRWSVDFPNAHRTVAATGLGIDDLREAIRTHFLGKASENQRPLVWTDRQRAFLQQIAVSNA